MKTLHVFVSGFVQGVGYRKFVKKAAEKEGLVGWVKNMPDGRVEAVLAGEDSGLRRVLAHCKKGPFLSEVENVEVVLEDSKEELKDFVILR